MDLMFNSSWAERRLIFEEALPVADIAEDESNQDSVEDRINQELLEEDADGSIGELINDLNDLLDSIDAKPEDRVKYQKEILNWILNAKEDFMIDENEREDFLYLIQGLQNEIYDSLADGSFASLAFQIKEAGGVTDELKPKIRERCIAETGEIDFGGQGTFLERHVGLTDLYDEPYLKININEAHKNAKGRRIPDNVATDGNYYLLVREDNKYVYDTPDSKKQKAYVFDGDEVSTETISTTERAREENEIPLDAEAEEIMNEYAHPSLDRGTYTLFTNEIQINEHTYRIRPTDLYYANQGTYSHSFPSDLTARLEETDISESYHMSNNLELTLQRDPDLKELANWLEGQFKQNQPMLKQMGIKNNFDNLTPPEAIKFVQYLMSKIFGHRISADYRKKPADQMDILTLSQNNEKIVCRNSMEIQPGYLMALQKNQARSGGGELGGMYVKSTSPDITLGPGYTPDLPTEHGWNQVYLANADGSISVMHLDPNWGVEENINFDYTKDRIPLTTMEILRNEPQKLIDMTQESVDALIRQFKSGDIKITDQVINLLSKRLRSFYFINEGDSLDYEGLYDSVLKLRDILISKGETQLARKLNTFCYIKRTLNVATSEMTTIPTGSEFESYGQGIPTLADVYYEVTYGSYDKSQQKWVFDPYQRDANQEYYMKNYGLNSEILVSYLTNIKENFSKIDTDFLTSNESSIYYLSMEIIDKVLTDHQKRTQPEAPEGITVAQNMET